METKVAFSLEVRYFKISIRPCTQIDSFDKVFEREIEKAIRDRPNFVRFVWPAEEMTTEEPKRVGLSWRI